MPSTIQSKPVACNALYSSNPVYSQNCAATSNHNAAHGANAPHPSIPHSKSLEHYNEPAKLLENPHGSRHSFDQSINYKTYDCIDGKVQPNETCTNGYHYGRNTGLYHQPTCGHQTSDGHYNILTGNRYPLPVTHLQSEHHYAQIVNFERGDNNYYTSAMEQTCCHPNPHYECLNNFNARN